MYNIPYLHCILNEPLVWDIGDEGCRVFSGRNYEHSYNLFNINYMHIRTYMSVFPLGVSLVQLNTFPWKSMFKGGRRRPECFLFT